MEAAVLSTFNHPHIDTISLHPRQIAGLTFAAPSFQILLKFCHAIAIDLNYTHACTWTNQAPLMIQNSSLKFPLLCLKTPFASRWPTCSHIQNRWVALTTVRCPYPFAFVSDTATPLG